MDKSDRVFFTNYAIDPEFESIREYDDFGDFDFDGDNDHLKDDIDYDDLDEYFWEDM
jgi:hypothetical protein